MRFKLDCWRKLHLFAAALFIAVSLMLNVPSLAAQDQVPAPADSSIEGSWQGTLTGPNGDRRMVVQIHKDGSGALRVTLFPLDMSGPMGVPRFAAKNVSFAGNNLKFSITFIGTSFEGKISNDHNSIHGSWTGQQGIQPLLLVRATPDTAWAISQPAPRIEPMATNANPGIEVATIKPSKPDIMRFKGLRINGDRLKMSSDSLQDMLAFAYNVEPKQIVNAPPWLNTDTYDVEIQPDQPGAPSKDQWSSILRKLLADRFQLKQHTEQRVLPAYILTVLKSGRKMTAVQDLNGQGGPEATRLRPGTMDAQGLSIPDFAATLRKILDRPVVDQTGLHGLYTFSMRWTPDESQFGGAAAGEPQPASDDPGNAPPPLFTALQEQLGLKLESGKTMVLVLVLDSVAKPSAN